MSFSHPPFNDFCLLGDISPLGSWGSPHAFEPSLWAATSSASSSRWFATCMISRKITPLSTFYQRLTLQKIAFPVECDQSSCPKCLRTSNFHLSAFRPCQTFSTQSQRNSAEGDVGTTAEQQLHLHHPVTASRPPNFGWRILPFWRMEIKCDVAFLPFSICQSYFVIYFFSKFLKMCCTSFWIFHFFLIKTSGLREGIICGCLSCFLVIQGFSSPPPFFTKTIPCFFHFLPPICMKLQVFT